MVSASRLLTPFTARAGPCTGSRSGAPIASSRPWASSFSEVSVPLATLKTSSVRSDSAASTLALAMSLTSTKSMVCVPSPRISGGSPASMRSIQRMSTSV